MDRRGFLPAGLAAGGLAAGALAGGVAPGFAAGAAQGDAPLRVLATVGMLADLAARVAADCAEVSALIGAGADPHLFTPRPTDLRRLSGAEVVVQVGLGLEGKLGEVLGRVGAVEIGPLAAAEARLLREAEGAIDPHLWMDVALWSGVLGPLSDAMGARRPACAGAMQARAEALRAEMLSLDAWVRDSVVTVPPAARVLITAHDAFGYYGRAYGLEVAALQGFSTVSEASIADLAQTADMIARRGVPAVFVETTINPRSIEALVEAAANAGASVQIGPPLFSDALGAEGTPEGSYAGMIVHNTRAIVTALGGAPLPLPAIALLR